ncbi:MAG: hypothetical protein PHN44_00080 [Candidatus Marinimicrobia bacterium]|nr:hypothetical protein [Candidatus Neomarinimicrobiota bacterium]
MKKFFLAVLFLAGFASAELSDLYQLIPPSCAYRCTTANFATTDSSFYTKIYTGTRYNAYWIMIAPGVTDSGIVMVHLSNNSDSTVRFPIKIRAIETGNCIAVSFDKIFRTGTTFALDSIWFGPFLRSFDE